GHDQRIGLPDHIQALARFKMNTKITNAAARRGPAVDREEAEAAAILARDRGATLREAAKEAGVRLATLCRGAAADPLLRRDLRHAAYMADLGRRAQEPTGLQRVKWSRVCPACGADRSPSGATGAASDSGAVLPAAGPAGDPDTLRTVPPAA